MVIQSRTGSALTGKDGEAEMSDREKVIKGLRCIIEGTIRCENCGYAIDKHGHYSCKQNCAADAIALLKEQKPKQVLFMEKRPVKPCNALSGFCHKCNHNLIYGVNKHFCGFCGQAVTWE